MSHEHEDTKMVNTAYGSICITHSATGAWALRSTLPRDGELDMAVDVIESVVLEHASAGVDVETDVYSDGITTALDAVCNHYGDLH